jgi:response regulator of citrate/malate metabolism
MRSKIMVACRDESLVRELRRMLIDAELVTFTNGARVPSALKLHATTRAVIVENAEPLSPMEVLEAARGAAPSVRRVLVTAQDDLQLVTEGLRAGVIHHLLYRPLDAHELFEALDLPRPMSKPVTVVYSHRPAPARA